MATEKHCDCCDGWRLERDFPAWKSKCRECAEIMKCASPKECKVLATRLFCVCCRSMILPEFYNPNCARCCFCADNCQANCHIRQHRDCACTDSPILFQTQEVESPNDGDPSEDYFCTDCGGRVNPTFCDAEIVDPL